MAVACLLSLVVSGIAYADNRTENIDLFLVIDKSLSMQSKIGAVKAYIDHSIIQNMLIPGDYVCIVDFYGEAHVIYSAVVGKDKEPVAAAVDSIRADGHWTDIGNALDKLREVIDSGSYPDHRKYFMLITDGMQEAPPTSKYYSPNGSFNHAFLANTKTIQEKGWKIEILGIGANTAAADLAKSVSGGFAQVSNNPTPQEIAQKAGELLGVVDASGVQIAPVGADGTSTLSLHLQSTGYSAARNITIGSVSLALDGKPAVQIAGNQAVSVPPNSGTDVKIPVTIRGLSSGSHAGTLTFTFVGGDTFSPAVVSTNVTVSPTGLQIGHLFSRNLWYLGGAAALVIILVLLAIVLVRRSSRESKITFKLTIEGDLKQSTRFTLKAGNEVLIQDTPMGFRAIEKQIADPVARVVFRAEGLRFEVIKAARLTVPTMPTNIMGESLKARTNSGKTIIFHFEPA